MKTNNLIYKALSLVALLCLGQTAAWAQNIITTIATIPYSTNRQNGIKCVLQSVKVLKLWIRSTTMRKCSEMIIPVRKSRLRTHITTHYM